ncbi:unnamed protein product [Rhodiola kirilowii]
MSLVCSARLPSSKKFTPPAKESKCIREAVVHWWTHVVTCPCGQRALPTRILTVGKTRSTGVQLLVDEYSEKLKCYLSVEVLQIRSNPKKAQDTAAQIREEDNAVMSTIGSNDWVILLDERGNEIRSEEMAELIARAGNTGASRLSFCIGGPYGHGPQLRERANVSIRLSSMVLNHQIALLVLIEQIYRAWTILKGQKYHH